MARKKKELTLVAAARPQLKKKAKRDWSKAKAERFLGGLADTCNVSEALRRSGVPLTVAYRRRKKLQAVELNKAVIWFFNARDACQHRALAHAGCAK